MHIPSHQRFAYILASAGFLTLFAFVMHQSFSAQVEAVSSQSQLAAIDGAGSGLVGWWTFDEGTGTAAADSSGNGDTGNLTSGATWAAGKIGSHAVDTSSSFGQVTLSSPVAIGSNWTVSAWSYFPLVGSSYKDLFKSSVFGNYQVVVTPTNYLGTVNSSVYSSGYNVGSLSGWHLITAVGTGGNTIFYVDGANVGTASAQNTDPISAMGNDGGSQWGVFDDARIYNRALTSGDIADLYAYTGGGGGGGGTPAPTYTLTVAKGGTGSGTVTGSSISCGSTCSQSGITSGTGITLTAAASSGSSFTSWSGCTSTSGSTCTENVTANTTVTATFTAVSTQPPTITNTTQASFPSGTTNVSMTVTTNVAATCKYDTSSGTAYSSMSHTFSTTGGIFHSTSVSGLADGTSYTYYVRCQDTNNNVSTSDTPIAFSVRTAVTLPQNATVIGSEALQQLPTSALYDGIVNFSPGDGETVTLNPPRFTWMYRPSVYATVCGAGSYGCPAEAPFKYVFQVADNQNFTNPIVNVTTLSNTYNFVPALTAGHTYYWRVGYIHPKNVADSDLTEDKFKTYPDLLDPSQLDITYPDRVMSQWTLKDDSWDPNGPYYWTTSRSFTIAGNATTWDRSMLADQSYLSARLGSHPFLLFTPQNESAYYNWIVLHSDPADPEYYTIGVRWNQIKTDAHTALAASWWPGTDPTGSGLALAFWSNAIAETIYVDVLGQSAPTGSPDRILSDQIRAADPGRALAALAQNYINQGENGVCRDIVFNHDLGYQLKALAYGYDWLHDQMTTDERATVLRALELHLKSDLYGGNVWWQRSDALTREVCDPTGEYNVGHVVSNQNSPFLEGDSHGIINFYIDTPAALACYADSDVCKLAYEMGLNYIIGQTLPFGSQGAPNAGRGYTFDQELGDYSRGLENYMMMSEVFPEAHLERNPVWAQQGEIVDRFIPVGLMGPADQWSDLGMGDFGNSWLTYGSWFARFAYAGYPSTGNLLATHFRNEEARTRTALNGIGLDPLNPYVTSYDDLPLLQDFPLPQGSAETSPLNRDYPHDGYAMGCSQPTSDPSCFKSGVGYIFVARPEGWRYSHMNFSDLSFDLWAYGTPLTAGGATSANSITGMTFVNSPLQRYSIMVNGLGELTQLMPNKPYYNRIYAYESTPDYTYIAADGTNGYPTGPNYLVDYAGQYTPLGLTDSYPYYAHQPLQGLQKVQRHFLFVKNKYFVIFDDLASSKPFTYSFLYHVLEPGLTSNQSQLSVTYSSNFWKFLHGLADGTNFPGFWQWFLTAWDPPTLNDWYLPTPPDVKVFVKQMNDPSTVTLDDRKGDNRQINPFTGENYSGDCSSIPNPGTGGSFQGIRCGTPFEGGQDLRSDVVWFNSKDQQTNFHFMTVIYPKDPADDAAHNPDPVITRLDDYTARVVNPDGTTDVISFNPDTAAANDATIVVDVPDMTPLTVPNGAYGTSQSVPSYTLSVAAQGNGTVTSSPFGINCGIACSTTVTSPTTYTLSAVPDSGATFTGWSGACSGTGTCSVNLNANKSVTAIFSGGSGGSTPPAKIKIMPMGDSITTGFGGNLGGGYRTYLWRALASSTYGGAVDFVGDQTPSGPSDIDQDNEAANGFGTPNMSQTFMGAVQSLQPDIILIHTGTNDIRGGDGVTLPPGEEGYLKELLSDIYTRDPNAIVLIAKIIKVAPSGTTFIGMNNTLIDSYNTLLQHAVTTRTNQSQDVRIVDMNSVLTLDSDYSSDGMHPNEQGNQKMANVWYPAVTQALSGIPDQGGGGSTPAAPVISSLTAINVTSSGATITWTTSTQTSTQVEYGKTLAYGSQTSKITNLASSHSQALSGLDANTFYYYRVTSIDGSNQTVQSTGTFTTGTANSAPTDQPSSGGGGGGSYGGGGGGGGGGAPSAWTISNIVVSGTATSGLTVSWKTSSAATSQVAFGLTTAYGSQTAFDPTYVSSHSMKITGLPVNTLYHLQIRSKDTYGTLVTSADLLAIISQTGSVSLGTPTSSTGGNTQTSNPSNTPAITGSITTWLLLGTTNTQVKTLQQILNASGFTVASSGTGSKGNETTYFGPATDAALKRFQCAKLQVCSGAAYTTGYGATGPMTRNALNALAGKASVPAVPTPIPVIPTSLPAGSITTWLLLGTTNSQVKTLQQILNAKGYQVSLSGTGSPGHESTYFGPATDAALKRFQCAKLQVCSGAAYTTGYGATGPKTRGALTN